MYIFFSTQTLISSKEQGGVHSPIGDLRVRVTQEKKTE